MRKHPPEVNVSEPCIDANSKMIESRDPDNFPRFPPQEWCAWTIPEIALKRKLLIFWKPILMDKKVEWLKRQSYMEKTFFHYHIHQGFSLASAIGHSPKIVPDVREFAVQFGQFVRDDFRKRTQYGYAQWCNNFFALKNDRWLVKFM